MDEPTINKRPLFIGCACDRRFVEPTAVMLSSIEKNGEVPDATILVATFELETEHRDLLRVAAGPLAERMQFIEITPAMLGAAARPDYTYPLPVLGRLFLAERVTASGARLLTVDSDMIVNVSLQGLVNRDLEGNAIAAVHDAPRHDDPNYFNSGLMLIDVDRFQAGAVAKRALLWLGEAGTPASFPDQDALNTVLAGKWFRLERGWNLYRYGEEREYYLADYEQANVVHYAGPKPWEHTAHAGAPLYRRYLAELRSKLARRDRFLSGVDRDFVATCYEVLLGRELEADCVLDERVHLSARDNVAILLKSEEFAVEVLRFLAAGEPLAENRHRGAPTKRQRLWAVDRLDIYQSTAARVEKARSWRELLTLIIGDRRLMSAVGLDAIKSAA